MIRFLISTIAVAATTFLFVRWARQQSERQIGKMQEAVFNSPGAEAPLPPAVIAAGIGLLAVQWFISRTLLGLKRLHGLLSCAGGLLLGIAAFLRAASGGR